MSENSAADFDGLVSAAKWIRGGVEPYPGADADAHAIDTRLGQPSPIAERIDRALRARPRDAGLFGVVVTIYRLPLERIAGGDPERLRFMVRRTVFHEIAHHFGISDARLVEIDRY